MKHKPSYKEPLFLFTSSSMRKAAWAGWYSALGNAKEAEEWVHQAYSEWAKEIGGGRKYSFVSRYSNDIYCLVYKGPVRHWEFQVGFAGFGVGFGDFGNKVIGFLFIRESFG